MNFKQFIALGGCTNLEKAKISGGFVMATNVQNNYPQMPPLTEEEITIFLNQPLIAKLGTLNDDGTIHIVPVIF
ncbi:MAG: hypothetical protein ACKOBL_14285, partial [Chloroflexota bacterium]